MIEELDTVVLRKNVTAHGLERGDVGTVVHRYSSPDESGYEVEFTTAEGETVAVLTLDRSEIRPMNRREILHARSLTEV